MPVRKSLVAALVLSCPARHAKRRIARLQESSDEGRPRVAALRAARRGAGGGRVTDDAQLKIGVLAWNQYTDWPALRDVGVLVDELGFDSLWTWDHLYPIVGDPHGPMFEGYMTL